MTTQTPPRIFPFPFSFFPSMAPQCCRGCSPPSKFNLSIIFITGAFPELLYPALVLSEEDDSKARWKREAAVAVCPVGQRQWGSRWLWAFACLCSACLFKENMEVEIFQKCQRAKHV